MSDLTHLGARRGSLRQNVPMHEHVSWRAGGNARQAYVPADSDDLCAFLATLPAAEEIVFIGLGSNTLVRDGGFDGTVILVQGALDAMHLQGGEEQTRIYAEVGVASPKLARFATNAGLAGAEWLAGVPGTVGGALAMNAGCYGAETWESVVRAHLIGRDGVRRVRERDQFDIGYRHCVLRDAGRALGRDEWFVAAEFQFVRNPDAQAVAQTRANMKAWLERRAATQPLNLPNAGSVFRNPPGDYAARLIEACGLKGKCIGGAQVSAKHANFIVNPEQTATAADIEQLIADVAATVERECGVHLEREVRIIGGASAHARAAGGSGGRDAGGPDDAAETGRLS